MKDGRNGEVDEKERMKSRRSRDERGRGGDTLTLFLLPSNCGTLSELTHGSGPQFVHLLNKTQA